MKKQARYSNTDITQSFGCREIIWKMPVETGFYQPIVIAKKTEISQE